MNKRIMTDEERKFLESLITKILASSVGWDYARVILESECEEQTETFMSSVIEDVLTTSAWEESGYYSDDDIRLAIGREFIAWLDIPY